MLSKINDVSTIQNTDFSTQNSSEQQKLLDLL
jgi:hypothetical protein